MASDRIQYHEEQTEIIVVQEEGMTVRLTMDEVRGLRSLMWNGSITGTLQRLGIQELANDFGRPVLSGVDDTGHDFESYAYAIGEA